MKSKAIYEYLTEDMEDWDEEDDIPTAAVVVGYNLARSLLDKLRAEFGDDYVWMSMYQPDPCSAIVYVQNEFYMMDKGLVQYIRETWSEYDACSIAPLSDYEV